MKWIPIFLVCFVAGLLILLISAPAFGQKSREKTSKTSHAAKSQADDYWGGSSSGKTSVAPPSTSAPVPSSPGNIVGAQFFRQGNNFATPWGPGRVFRQTYIGTSPPMTFDPPVGIGQSIAAHGVFSSTSSGGATSSFSGSSISGTVLEGYPYYFYYGTRVPFVTSYVPVVSHYPVNTAYPTWRRSMRRR